MWVQVFHIKRSRTTRKICEVTLLCGSDNSSTYLPHVFNLPYVIHTWAINNGNRTEWSPIRSVTIRVIIKIGRPRNGSWIFWLRVWLQIELDDLNSCFQLVRTMTKFERENRHQLYVFIKKTTINSAKCATTSLTVHLHRHDVSTVLLVLKSGWWQPITFENFVMVLIRSSHRKIASHRKHPRRFHSSFPRNLNIY